MGTMSRTEASLENARREISRLREREKIAVAVLEQIASPRYIGDRSATKSLAKEALRQLEQA